MQIYISEKATKEQIKKAAQDLDTKSLLLDMSNNLSRIGKFALSNNDKRCQQFMKETYQYLKEVKPRDLEPSLQKTIDSFEVVFSSLQSSNNYDKYFADDAFTYASILMHRATPLTCSAKMSSG